MGINNVSHLYEDCNWLKWLHDCFEIIRSGSKGNSLMLLLPLLISSEVPIFMSSGMQTYVSALLAIIKGMALLCNVALFRNVR